MDYHYLDATITAILLSLSMITGALSLLIKGKLKKYILIAHGLISVLAYVAFMITYLRAPTFQQF